MLLTKSTDKEPRNTASRMNDSSINSAQNLKKSNTKFPNFFMSTSTPQSNNSKSKINGRSSQKLANLKNNDVKPMRQSMPMSPITPKTINTSMNEAKNILNDYNLNQVDQIIGKSIPQSTMSKPLNGIKVKSDLANQIDKKRKNVKEKENMKANESGLTMNQSKTTDNARKINSSQSTQKTFFKYCKSSYKNHSKIPLNTTLLNSEQKSPNSRGSNLSKTESASRKSLSNFSTSAKKKIVREWSNQDLCNISNYQSTPSKVGPASKSNDKVFIFDKKAVKTLGDYEDSKIQPIKCDTKRKIAKSGNLSADYKLMMNRQSLKKFGEKLKIENQEDDGGISEDLSSSNPTERVQKEIITPSFSEYEKKILQAKILKERDNPFKKINFDELIKLQTNLEQEGFYSNGDSQIKSLATTAAPSNRLSDLDDECNNDFKKIREKGLDEGTRGRHYFSVASLSLDNDNLLDERNDETLQNLSSKRQYLLKNQNNYEQDHRIDLSNLSRIMENCNEANNDPISFRCSKSLSPEKSKRNSKEKQEVDVPSSGISKANEESNQMEIESRRNLNNQKLTCGNISVSHSQHVAGTYLTEPLVDKTSQNMNEPNLIQIEGMGCVLITYPNRIITDGTSSEILERRNTSHFGANFDQQLNQFVLNSSSGKILSKSLMQPIYLSQNMQNFAQYNNNNGQQGGFVSFFPEHPGFKVEYLRTDESAGRFSEVSVKNEFFVSPPKQNTNDLEILENNQGDNEVGKTKDQKDLLNVDNLDKVMEEKMENSSNNPEINTKNEISKIEENNENLSVPKAKVGNQESNKPKVEVIGVKERTQMKLPESNPKVHFHTNELIVTKKSKFEDKVKPRDACATFSDICTIF